MQETSEAISPLYYDKNYDPRYSLLSFTSIYGDGTQITFDDLQYFINNLTTSGILFGVRFGSSFMTLLIMWMVYQKKNTPIFIINQVALLLIILHDILEFAYLFSNLSSAAFSLTGFSQFITRNNIHIYGAINIFQVLLVATIEVSLVYQIKVIFAGTTSKKHGIQGLLVGTSFLGLATTAMYFVTAITGMVSMYKDVNTANAKYFNVAAILLTSSINLTTIILVIKLVLAIKSRRYLGLKQFSSFHILLIMLSQTLIIPSILLILSYSLTANRGTDKLFSVGTLLAVLSLPLSSLWATSANTQSKPEYDTSSYTLPTSSGESYLTFENNGLYSPSNNGKGKKQGTIDNIISKVSFKSHKKVLPNMKQTKSQSESATSNESSFLSETTVHDLEKQSKLNATYSITKEVSDDFEVYTPTTAAENEARTFWTENSSIKSQFQNLKKQDTIQESCEDLDSAIIETLAQNLDDGMIKTKKVEYKHFQ
ncbi:hypothetical protein TBLA_0D02540 [Henningerozyma blattae CBS 6284]|uniref:Pheromone alpha factor receptor n=1 Tax=Henningerozyma blattae (strain ATCC 34711 / CBS 6284 / DSM 70876 / NBRC 10599 / NRRL Y-10934 / UCD 77-7) TaxID=1071380 RepID=I2H305_HENB6|nr:hypothetical protein TBLA_0D02540 [Tetrapisispora blattae CBS 6284]CCH60757.1 hypothetical protein TBLA_0D02540 [Tetrapisispora blattae CBS 6284]